MGAALNVRTRMGRATLASIGIHVLAALAIPALVWTAASVPPVETVSFTRILHIQIVPPRVPHPPPRAVAPRHSAKPTVNLASPAHIGSFRSHKRASPEPMIAADAPAAPSVGAPQRAGAGNVESNAAPDVTPSPAARSVASIGAVRPGGYLPFGAEQPAPVLDPGVLKQLGALGAHVTLLVTVGDDGKTESVLFNPPIDPQLESRIRSMLADADWDPAVCGGGVACESQATIKL
ncbi:MAG: hypothetical protein JO104_06535 [Candidatus Eremiobacteraeota bacterium]|nr:hypothetical protein [Candidatus Eremiobacteraeota bacterium]